jgi:hypothetical protein
MPVAPTSASIERMFQRLNELERSGLIGRYAIGGAFAFIYYAEPFETSDVDVFAHIPRDEHILIEGVPVQILPAAGPLVEEAIERAQEITVGKEPTRVFTAEHAVAVALKTNRAKDRLKILHLIETAPTPLNRGELESILTRHGLLDKWRKFEAANRG